jgi:hypothetical protein
MKKIIFFFCILMLTQIANATDISKLNGEWYSYKWKYGYTLKDGKGYATIVNSPNFKEGQEIVRLAALSDTSFFGENVYKDGKFYKVKVTLKPDGKLYFEGEKNAKWEMEKINKKTLSKLKDNFEINESLAEKYGENRASIKNTSSAMESDIKPNESVRTYEVSEGKLLNCGVSVNCQNKSDVEEKMRTAWLKLRGAGGVAGAYADVCFDSFTLVKGFNPAVTINAGIIQPQLNACNVGLRQLR